MVIFTCKPHHPTGMFFHDGQQLIQQQNSAVAQIGNNLATIDMGQKLGGGAVPLLGGSWVPI